MVVAAALFDTHGRLLAACRNAPPELAGRWELPGGKVEAGETPETALVRECHEELGVTVALGVRVGADWPLEGPALLRVWRATVTEGDAEPLEDHSELRWLPSGHWFSVAWLDGDMPVIRALVRREDPAS